MSRESKHYPKLCEKCGCGSECEDAHNWYEMYKESEAREERYRAALEHVWRTPYGDSCRAIAREALSDLPSPVIDLTEIYLSKPVEQQPTGKKR